MKVVIIDNYDSFTYNLSHLVKELGAEVTVYRNDQFKMEQLEAFDKIILSPGPGIPCEAGLLLDVIKAYAGKKPILGVCLGHQAIGESFGGHLTNLSEVYHGVATPTTITIRTFVSRNNELWFQAGGGIVAKSNVEYELQEVNNKLGALRKAISIAETL